VSFYLDRARAAARANAPGAATEVRQVIDGLVRTFEKVYRDRGLVFAVEAQDGLRFRGESQDLTDLIGNLLDNAGKWARGRIVIHAERDPQPDAAGRLYFTAWIDDDGPEIDESRPGSGLGLSIVVDIAAVYGGSLRLEESPLGGLRASLRLPRY
jgi:signal transduction histidine kinase